MLFLDDDDDEEEPQLKVVGNYHFVNGDEVPVSFWSLPFQYDEAEEAAPCKKDVFLRGTADGGLQQVYKQVIAWKLGLDGRQPEVTVLSKDGKWIGLSKPRTSYENTIRTILITVQMLHFLRRNPEGSEKRLWDHLRGVFDKFEVRPSEDDLRNHHSLLKLFAERDPTLAKSQLLRGFADEKPRKKADEVNSGNMDIKQPFIADDEEIEEMVEDGNDSESDEPNDLFDSVCAICDNGGELLCCEGPCMRSFHATKKDGEESDCRSLGFSKAQLDAIQNYLCKNCERNQHQCFVCGELGSSDVSDAKVLRCFNATCGHFYHPKCVAALLHPDNMNEASECEKRIAAGMEFTCPVHRCFVCKKVEDKSEKQLQFAMCRRCPKSYHRKCLPREIAFEDIEEEGIITRAWDYLFKSRILIYCLEHDIVVGLGTPTRDHLKFPDIPEKKKTAILEKKKVKDLVKKKKVVSDDMYLEQPSAKAVKFSEKPGIKEGGQVKRIARTSPGQTVPLQKKVKRMKEKSQPEQSVEVAAPASCPKPVKEREKLLAMLPSSATAKITQSSFPVVDNETEKRMIALAEKVSSSLTLADISRKCMIPSTHAYSGRHIERTITRGKLEGSIQAVQAALQKLDSGGSIDDAKAVCEPEILKQLAKWSHKLKVYLAPFIHGMRYTSFGRHFTKVEKLVEIVDKLHWYVQDGDTIVDFCCGANDFSRLMKEKLDAVGKKCNFKNYDVIAPKNDFNFEKRDWMKVQPKELPEGSQLIMGLNPPFGVKAALANKFIDKALTFKPKLIILIVPKETERLDRKRPPYDLIWVDNQSLSGKSFYLPGSVDVNDKQMDQWNASPPPLYLWSHSDWTDTHKGIAEKHGHTTIGEKGPLVEGEEKLPLEKHTEAVYEQNSHGGNKDEIHRDEKKSSEPSNRRTPDQVDTLPPEKQVEVAYEERKATPNRKDESRGDRKDACRESVKNARPGNKRTQKVSNIKSRKRSISKKRAEVPDIEKADSLSDMSISPSLPGTKNAINQSVVPPPDQSKPPFEREAHQGSYARANTEFGASSIGCHSPRPPGLPVDNFGDSAKRYSTNLDEISQRYSAPSIGEDIHSGNVQNLLGSGGVGGRNYSMRNSEDRFTDHKMDQSDAYGRTMDADSRAHIRMYGGQIGDEYPQKGRTPDADAHMHMRMNGRQTVDDYPLSGSTPDADAWARIRMYGGQNGDDCPDVDARMNIRMYSGQSGGDYTDADAWAHIRKYGGQSGDDYPPRGRTPEADSRARIRMYGGQSVDDYPQRTRTPDGNARTHIRMYGQSGDDYPQRSGYPFGPSDARLVQPAFPSSAYGLNARTSAMDKYAPHLNETNYPRPSNLDPRAPFQGLGGMYAMHGYGRGMPPDPTGFAPRQQYPLPRPGSSGGWINN